MCGRIEVGDQVVCIDDGASADLAHGVLTQNKVYTVTAVSNSSLINVSGVNQRVSRGRFKLASGKKPEHGHSKADMYKLMVVGAVVECIDAQGFLPNEGLVKGQRYKVLKDQGSKLTLEGLCTYTLVKTRFKIVPTNDIKINGRESLYKKLEEFRGVGSFNELIVNEGMYYCETDSTWKSKKEGSERWVFYIKGAWTMFNVGS